MTVTEMYERQIKDLPATEQLRLAALILERVTRASDIDEGLRRQARQLTPTNAALLKAASGNAPPQSWWDEAEDPFKSE